MKFYKVVPAIVASVLGWVGLPAHAADPDVVTIKVGGVLTLTGPGAFWHLTGGKAQMVFFKHLNEQGGVPYTEPDGTKKRFVVDYKYEDSVYDTKKVVTAYNRLKEWGAHVVTTSGSSPGAALVAPSARDKLPVVNDWSVHPDPDHYRNNTESQYLLPNMPSNVDTSGGLLYLYKKHVWEKKHPGQRLKVGIVSFDNPPRRLYKERWVSKFYEKMGVDIVGVALVPMALTDVSIELKRLHEAGAKVVLIDHVVSGAKVVLENAERLGIRKDLDFITWYFTQPQFAGAPQLFDGVYHPWPVPSYYSADRTSEMEEVGKIYLKDDSDYWAQHLDVAMPTHLTMSYATNSIKQALEKHGFKGLTGERIRGVMFGAREVTNRGLYPRYSIDPQSPFTLPYNWLYRFDAKSKSYAVLGKPVAPGPSELQPRWNPTDDPSLVETGFYR